MLEADIIEPSYSSWNSSLLLISIRPDDSRVVNDYRLLNKITVEDNYPLPNLYFCPDLLGGAKYYVVLGMTGAYWQIPLGEKESRKICFHYFDWFISV